MSPAAARILVVEDNPDNACLVVDLLRAHGYAVVHAAQGEAAVALAEGTHPDLVILDIRLPQVDGLTIARALRGHPDLAGVPILGLSANAMRSDREAAMAAGCDEYLTKPIGLPELVRGVQRLLAGTGPWRLGRDRREVAGVGAKAIPEWLTDGGTA